MSTNVYILNIGPGSDGDGRRRPKTDDFTRNDAYYLERLATDKWAKDQGLPTSRTYRLDRLPNGYTGYEKQRGSDSKHVDRYVYGHPNGQFRSMNEFYPHFKHLMDNANTYGCPCKLCTGKSYKKGPGVRLDDDSNSAASGSPAQQSPFFAQPAPPHPRPPGLAAARPQTHARQKLPAAARAKGPLQPTPRGRPRQGLEGLAYGRPDPSPAKTPRRKQVDEEGTPDVYRGLIDRLKAAGPEGQVNELIVESMSPDWRTGHRMLINLLREWKELPGYVPRHGELVMFVRHLGPSETLGWDGNAQTFRIVDLNSKSWVDKPKWEAGVVTQMPTEAISDEDLVSTPASKQHSVINSGFRIEPLSQPSSISKQYTKQHKYVPLHGMRPLALWKECLHGINEQDWHPTIRHALTVTSTFCVIGKYQFKGTWPDATIFAQGLYIGPELVMVGDAVRLCPREQQVLSDVMVITAIKMRLVNLDEASDDDYDEGHPYNTCIHISGRTYTQDPTRSFDGVGKVPIPEASPLLPAGTKELGTWYHVCDPKKTKARIEVPYQRVIGRCYESAALQAWVSAPAGVPPPASGFQAVNAKPIITINHAQESSGEISRGLSGIVEARAYSQQHDSRIDKQGGKTWYWADTRIEQLDLHEVNGRFVGLKDEGRSRRQMEDWRKALKALDGKRGGVEEYHAARREREVEQARWESALGASSSGLVAGGALAGGAAGVGVAEAMEVTEPETEAGMAMGPGSGGGDAMDVDVDVNEESGSSSEMEVEAGNALAAFKAAPAPVLAVGESEVITLDDDDDED